MSAVALAALATAFVHLLPVSEARAQSAATSPFQPSLSDPRNIQRFSSSPQRRSTAAPSPPLIEPPPEADENESNSGVTGTKKKKAKKKPGDPNPLPPPPPPPPGAQQRLAGHGVAPQIAVRAAYGDAYRPPDAQPRRPTPPVVDAFEPIGIRAGGFLLKPAIEITRGYDTNASRFEGGKPAAFTLFEPTLKARSEWSRHEAGLDLRGSYSNYDNQSSLNRPMLDAKGYGRIDVTRDTNINTEARFLLSTDYPGSPNLPVGFAQLPVFTAYGGTAGLTQRFNHLELSAKVNADRTQYQETQLLDGSTSSNKDRDFNQFGGALRASYEVFPGVKPFVEVGGDTRKHDLQFDRDGLERNSTSLTPRVGTTFDIARKLTGEISIGYLNRKFADPSLVNLSGIVADASLIWNATGLTTATLTATSRGDETVLPGVSGTLRRDIGVQVDHALRRWLIWTVRAGYGFDDYVGAPCACNGFLERADKRTSLGTALTYKFSREVSIKGEYRYDRMRSNAVGADYDANVFLLGLKFQR